MENVLILQKIMTILTEYSINNSSSKYINQNLKVLNIEMKQIMFDILAPIFH